jgi:RIO kinase 1
MDSPLDHLLEEGIISEVVGRLQSGKEAEVFLVRFGERIVAAKVYKDRTQRSFKNNSAYKEGRGVRNTRDQRAMGRRSRFGKNAEEDAWKSAEADALYRLHAAGVRVPTPVLYFEGVLLMELVVDAEGVTARRLVDTALSAEQASAAYHDMLAQLVRMLACDLIHGDLSPYNVLWGASGVTIIDFPQIVSAAQNSNSERFFLRDAENILGHLRRLDSRLEARRSDAAEIWRAYMRRELSADFVPTGKMRPPAPQRPLPIGAPRPSGHGYGPPRPQNKTERRPPQQSAAQPRPQRNHGAPPQPQRGNAPARRPMPEVIVRPRAAPVPARTSGSAEGKDSALPTAIRPRRD